MKLLLFNIGLSNIGDWIYLIAFNLIVLDMTGSPFAVAVLYLLKPAAAMMTNGWAGSFIDRLDARGLMIWLDTVRGLLIIILPFFSSLIIMYCLVFLVNMASAMFRPASMVYMTSFLAKGERKRFNALRSLVDSGGFLLGPGIAGLMFWIGSPWAAVYLNGATFLLSAFLTLWLPSVRTETMESSSFSIREDWKLVVSFSHTHAKTMIIYSLFTLLIVMTAAIDSLEAAFSKQVLGLSNPSYGILVSIAGGGIILGAVIQNILIDKTTTRFSMSGGGLGMAMGYLIYAFSNGFLGAAIGCFLLSFSLAFANTGFLTFYQDHIPPSIMGRVGSLYEWGESFVVILSVITIGLLAEAESIRLAVCSGCFLMLFISLALVHSLRSSGEERHVAKESF
ncbi:MFS transporter [Halobacillus salinus]|uniref:MFS transporter n=1 Tax=Halobacillus salinus TaxID=192814 RepID=A0A4Z0H566_9BACI|nr:MFS transporter [Halobacillus salinus]TGB04919.1 MFS transporter [Halobacillus salinus]